MESIIWYMTFCISILSYCGTHQYFISFYGRLIFHCMYTPQLVYPFVCLYLGVAVNSTIMNICVQVFQLSWAYSQEWNCWPYDNCWSYDDPPNCFLQWLHQFTFLPAMYEDSIISTSSAKLIFHFIYFLKL